MDASRMEATLLSITDLRCQVPAGVLAIGAEPVRLTWRVAPPLPGHQQEAYEIEVASRPDFAAFAFASGVVTGDEQVAVEAPGGSLASREERFYRVRIRSASGWTPWSPVLRVEAGLLLPEDWQAVAVTLPDDPGALRQSPSPLVRHEFDVPGPVRRARLYATSLGLHEAFINGQPVSDELLAPGWTTYRHRLLTETTDVTSLVHHGRNAIGAILGDGWYRGRLGWDPGEDRCRYGTQVGFLAQLEIELTDGSRMTVATDESWRASTGELLMADLYDGCLVDLRAGQPGWTAPGFPDEGWQPVAVVPLDRVIIAPRVAPPVRVVAELQVDPERRPDGTLRLDGGQNVAGFVRLRVRGTAGARVTVRHAEVLEPDGSLHTLSLRSAKATDTYVLTDDAEVVLAPRMTFHGFRYADVETDAEVLDAAIVAISSDTPRRSRFASSHGMLDRLHENVVWSQRDNFVSVPTDCPQRDERLGWTGDAQAFAPTGSTLFDSQAFWASWLRDLELDQDDKLGVPAVVPDVIVDGVARFGRAGWADAATIVPWAVYESYGDRQVLRDQLPSMRRHIDSLQARLGPDGLLWPSDMQFGDWLDPDAPVARPWEAKADSEFLANAYLVCSARLAADASALLGDHAWAAETRALGDAVARVTWERWADHARQTQTGCAAALLLGVAPEEDRASIAETLSDLVRDSEGRVRTGFLGTPLVLPALSDAGHFEAAYLMLLRTEMPSWLYQVRQGATTIWERWDAIRPDGSIHPGTMSTPPSMAERKEGEPHMLSFNHYAYGAVIDWVYRNVAGLATDRARPGYRHVLVAPRPVEGIDRAEAAVDSPYGSVSISWRLDDQGTLRARLELPFGTSATFRPPLTEASRVLVDGDERTAPVALGPGDHDLTVTAARVVGRSVLVA